MRSLFTRLVPVALVSLLVASTGSMNARAAGEPYIIGAILSESGPGATLGRPEADSMEMAVDEINKTGGVGGHQLALTILDDQSDATTAVNDFRQLLDSPLLSREPLASRQAKAQDSSSRAGFRRQNHRHPDERGTRRGARVQTFFGKHPQLN